MYARIENNQAVEYPYTIAQLQNEHPNTTGLQSASPEALLERGVVVVVATGQPEFSPFTHKVVEAPLPAFSAERNRWEQVWGVEPLTVEEATTKLIQFQANIVSQTQTRLDDFAATRGYDGILSACTYAASGVPKFQSEGQYCVNQRDATWATLYTLMGEVQAGTRPMPASYADIEPLLPALVWPA